MRFLLPIALCVLPLAAAGCSSQPESGAATANAEVLADQLQAKANNYSMQADNTTSSEAALALENASAALGEQSANLRAAAHPNEKMK